MTRAAAVLACLLLAPGVLRAQDTASSSTDAATAPAAPDRRSAALGKFLAGAAVGLGAHETGHVVASALVGASPGLAPVSFGPIPFFAITHEPVTPGREYTIAASGFFVQHATSEWLLTKRPTLIDEQAPVAKGLLAFNVLTSVVYATAAFGRFGPDQRDTLAMADALGVGEPWVGALVLAPAAVDAWRYYRPRSRVAPWVSRALKIGAVVVVVRAAR